MTSYRYPLALLATVLAFWTWSGIHVHDTRLTWVLETLPFMIALPVLLFTYRKFPLTHLAYTLIAIHAMILMLGGHYSYARVPLGFWMEDWFGWTRNNYDKIGHFMQGFGPAIYVREVLVRASPVKRGGWLAFMSVCVPLAFSARCFTARHYGLNKDDCQFKCLDHPEGLTLKTREGQDFLCINGIQTMSAQSYNLLHEVPALRALGIDILRISPQAAYPDEIIAAFDAAIAQATAGHGGYGQGWEGYGKRLGAAVADNESGMLFQRFLFPALLHQDPRYFRRPELPLVRRMGYAASLAWMFAIAIILLTWVQLRMSRMWVYYAGE